MNAVNEFAPFLIGKDIGSIRMNSIIVQSVRDQSTFDELFKLMFHHERPLAVRAADAVEKITRTRRYFLSPHKYQLLTMLKSADHKELKRHLVRFMPRLELTAAEVNIVYRTLTYWALNRHERKIVRAHSLQALSDFSQRFPELRRDFDQTVTTIKKEVIPSLHTRIRKLGSNAGV